MKESRPRCHLTRHFERPPRNFFLPRRRSLIRRVQTKRGANRYNNKPGMEGGDEFYSRFCWPWQGRQALRASRHRSRDRRRRPRSHWGIPSWPVQWMRYEVDEAMILTF